jgi:hypothetical protein
MKMSKVLTAIALAATATAALAIVTFDPGTGAGFVGKGDVQIAFGWNNAQLQNRAGGITFTYNDSATFDVRCEWNTETGNDSIIHHDITVPRHRNISAAIEYDARVRTQITGFKLKKFASNLIIDGNVPQVGDTCPGNSDHGLVTEVTPTGSTGGGLYVHYSNGAGHLCTPGASCSP